MKHDTRSQSGSASFSERVAPFRLYQYPRLRSTSDHAKVLIDRGSLILPAVVFTPHQLAGRGRGDNTWWSGAGCLTATFALPVDATLSIQHIPLYAGVAIRDALVSLTNNPDLLLKWPNDLMYAGRKLAGLLCERHRDVDLIGLGLNIAPRRVPKPLAARVTSLQEMTREVPEIDQVLHTLSQHLGQMLSRKTRPGFHDIRREYDQHHLLLGRDVVVWTSASEPVTTGRCEGVDEDGRLLVRSGRQLHRVIAGTVRLSTE